MKQFKAAFTAELKYSLIRVALMVILLGVIGGMYIGYLASDYHTKVVDPNEGPAPWYHNPGPNTAPVPCDWCSQMTSHPAPAGTGKATPSATPTTSNGTSTVTVYEPAPKPSP